jgi:hypothetical protein
MGRRPAASCGTVADQGGDAGLNDPCRWAFIDLLRQLPCQSRVISAPASETSSLVGGYFPGRRGLEPLLRYVCGHGGAVEFEYLFYSTWK